MSRRRDSEERFRERYGLPQGGTAEEVERQVIGVAGGANGYTTVAQADLLAERVALGRGSLLLDIGSGRGWPGLYLAAQTGCRAVLSDLPKPALETAVRRADRDGLGRRVSVIQASGDRPPFPIGTFDAVTHTDTL